MALALLLAIEQEANGVRVSYDIGKNHFIRWQLGDEEQRTSHGLPVLANVQQRSSLLGPVRPEARGRGEFIVPHALINRDSRALQIISYRNQRGEGPAVSAVVNLPVVLHRGGEPTGTDIDLPVPAGMAITKQLAPSRARLEKDRNMTSYTSAFSQQVDNVPFALRERRTSKAMVTGAEVLAVLTPLLPLLAPAVGSLVAGVAPAIGQVANQFIRSVTGGAGGDMTAPVANLADQTLRSAGTASQQLLTPENIRQIMALIQTAQTAAPATGATAAAMSRRRRYSEAKVAPALLAALPALMPLLQQVLSPQTIQGIIEAPQRMTGQVINGITDFARLGLQADQQLHDHLRALNPGVDDPALHQLLASMSLGMSGRRTQNYKRVTSVRLRLEGVKTQVVFGRSLSLYQQGSVWQFPLSIDTPQPIRSAELMIQLKRADNLRVVHESSDVFDIPGSGPLELVPRIESQVTEGLLPQQDYIVVLTLTWPNSKGQRRGTSIQHAVSLMGQYRFDRIEEDGELIPLNNRETYRDYWHEVWNHSFDRETRRIECQTRYYLTLNPERHRNARVDVDIRRETKNSRQHLRLRSGYEYSLFALNHLLGRLAPDQQPLDETLLEAIASSDFVERFNQAAQHQAEFRGRPGDNVALWVFPVIRLQTLVLVKAEGVDENGNLGNLIEERVKFPMPVMMHFVGVKQS